MENNEILSMVSTQNIKTNEDYYTRLNKFDAMCPTWTTPTQVNDERIKSVHGRTTLGRNAVTITTKFSRIYFCASLSKVILILWNYKVCIAKTLC